MRKSSWLLVALLVSGICRAGDLSPEQKAFYDQYRSLVELSDERGVTRMVGEQKGLAELVLVEQVDNYFRSDNPEVLADLEALAKGLDEIEGGKRFAKRLEFVRLLDAEYRTKRQGWSREVVTAAQTLNEARRDENAGAWRRALAAFDELSENFVNIGDLEWASYCRAQKGICHDNLGEYLACVEAFDLAMDEWLAAGRPKDPTYNFMVDRRRELIGKGFEPGGGEAEGDTQQPNTGTSYVEGSEWQDWELDYKTMRSPTAFQTPSPMGGDNYYLWRTFSYIEDGVHPLCVISSVQPFGTQLQVVKDGSKAMLDLDGDGAGDERIKIIDGRGTLAEIKNGKGKDADKYAMFLMTQGDGVYLGYETQRQGIGGFRTGCYRQGKILDTTLTLIDDNGSGAIGDNRELNDGITAGSPAYWDVDAMIVGKGKVAGPYSDFLIAGDKVYRLKLSDSLGRAVRTRELDAQTGLVQVKWNGPKPPKSLVIREIAEFSGGFFDVAGRKPVAVPVGKYKVAIGKIETGSKTNSKQAWILPGEGRSFDVRAGETTVLEMGGPYRMEFKTQNESRLFRIVGTSIKVFDRFGAEIARIYDEVPLFEATVKAESGTVLAKGEEMSRVSREIFFQGEVSGWYPANLEVDKGPVECQAQLKLKKHGLLGGPFESDWQ